MEIVTGIVHRVTYANQENGYCVVKVTPTGDTKKHLFDIEEDTDQTITVTGSLLMLKKGDQVDFQGEWKRHAKYGTYLDTQKFHVHPPTSEIGLKAFLATDHFKGIGPVTAEKLVEKFGEKLGEVIENTPSKLSKVKGVNAEKAREIHDAWLMAKSIREEMVALQGLGITPHTAHKIIGRYPGNAVMVIRENPYQLAQDIWGVGFAKADEIAKAIGFNHDHPFRIESGIEFALLAAMDDGHMFLPREKLTDEARQVLEVNPDVIEKHLDHLINSTRLIKKEIPNFGTAIYLPDLYTQEEELAKRLTDLNKVKKSKLAEIKKSILKSELAKLEKKRGFPLAAEQEKAIYALFESPITILTGGPGTGKSTTIATLLAILHDHHHTVALTAPTGRAAKRMEEITGTKAFTLHRLLQLKPGEIAKFNQTNPLPYDVVIVDEVSMLDTFLALHLMRAIDNGTHVLFVGDADQLPSVGAGNVLADMISSQSFTVVRLQTIFRQAQESAIIRNAHKIRDGIFPEFPKHPTDFYFFPTETPEETLSTVVDLVTKRIPQEFHLDAKNAIQVMAPLYKTVAGVSNLNTQIQLVLNPPTHKKNEVKAGFALFREGDRVMQLKNNYEKDVFNGDIGIVTGAEHKENTTVSVTYPDRDPIIYTNEELRELTLAYAVSVHKSQGSEYPVVVMPIVTSHYIMLQRNLLYTAVTRAKKLVVLVGSKRAIFIALKNNKPQERFTGLMSKLIELGKKQI